MAFGNSDIFLLMSFFSAISFYPLSNYCCRADVQGPSAWQVALFATEQKQNWEQTLPCSQWVPPIFMGNHSPLLSWVGGTKRQIRPWLPLVHSYVNGKRTPVTEQSCLPPGITVSEAWAHPGLQRASHFPSLACFPPSSHSTSHGASKCDSFVFVSCLFLIN